MVWVETPTNPLLGIADIAALADARPRGRRAARRRQHLRHAVPPAPLTLGADVVVHSTTKYAGGHSDVVGGAVVVRDLDLAEKRRLPPERHGRGGRAVRRLAHAARPQDPRRSGWTGTATTPSGSCEFLHRRRAASSTSSTRAWPTTPATRSRRSRWRASAAWSPSASRAARQQALAGLRPGRGVHAGRVARRHRVADRAPRPDDPRQRRRHRARGARRPGPAQRRHRDRRRPARRPRPAPLAEPRRPPRSASTSARRSPRRCWSTWPTGAVLAGAEHPTTIEHRRPRRVRRLPGRAARGRPAGRRRRGAGLLQRRRRAADRRGRQRGAGHRRGRPPGRALQRRQGGHRPRASAAGPRPATCTDGRAATWCC